MQPHTDEVVLLADLPSSAEQLLFAASPRPADTGEERRVPVIAGETGGTVSVQ